MKTFNVQVGGFQNPKVEQWPYMFRLEVNGLQVAVHERHGRLHISEWSTGCCIYSFLTEDPDGFGLDLIAEAKVIELIDKHGMTKINRLVSQLKEVNK